MSVIFLRFSKYELIYTKKHFYSVTVIGYCQFQNIIFNIFLIVYLNAHNAFIMGKSKYKIIMYKTCIIHNNAEDVCFLLYIKSNNLNSYRRKKHKFVITRYTLIAFLFHLKITRYL